jgi:PAS domain S-box-containing protein
MRTAKNINKNINNLRWTIPALFAMVSVLYQFVIVKYIYDNYGQELHWIIEIAFYGTVGPLFTFWIITRIGHWLGEKDTLELLARASEVRLASVIAASADAIISLDAQGSIESWNHGAELIFGYRAQEMQGRPLAYLFGGSEASNLEISWLTQVVRELGFVRGHETTCHDAEGRRVAVDLTATSLAGVASQPDGMSIILRDITERQHREAEIIRLNTTLSEQVAERTRELVEKVEQLASANAELQKLDQMRTEFVSLVSHQIRAPLTNMRGAVERMGMDCGAVNLTCSRMFGILEQQAERLDHLVRDLLNAARLEAGELVLQPEPISVMPVMQQVAEQMRARVSQRTILVPAKSGLPLVFADRERVAEVLTNLLDNADKYSPPGMDVSLDVYADQTEVMISVRDAGRGIPQADLEHVFDKFYRADNSDAQSVYGYGLGLYVCRRLIEAQGGRIWVENVPGGGAIFSFTLLVAR